MKVLLEQPATLVGRPIPRELSRVQLQEIFAAYGPLTGRDPIRFPGRGSRASKDDHFLVEFKCLKDAKKAVKALNRTTLRGALGPLSLQFDKQGKIRLAASEGNAKAIQLLAQQKKALKLEKEKLASKSTSSIGSAVEPALASPGWSSFPSSFSSSPPSG
eukprot:GHVT01031308.1.p1 GENE.GHVT01031308.1~~GHVT01031308.1.p1  ORF type:complete len:160 (-),score=31.92 GHVT01031308.1:94-573(-)